LPLPLPVLLLPFLTPLPLKLPEQGARLDAVSARPPIYPYWHQWEEFADRNPPPVPMAKY